MAGQFDNIKFELLGESDTVRDWQGLQLLATFSDDNAQPNISTSELSFVGEMGQALINYIDGGVTGSTNGIYEGPDFTMSLNTPNSKVFEGIVNLSDNITVIRNRKEVKAKLLKSNGLNTFSNVSQAITMGLLENKKVFSKSDYVDIPYIKDDPTETLLGTSLLIINIYMLTDQIAKATKEIADIFTDTAGETAGGLSGPIAGPIMGIARGITNGIYLGFMLFELIKMMDDLIEIILPPIKYHRGIKLKTLISKGCEFAGYEYVNTINDLDNLYLIPEKKREGRSLVRSNDTGLPISGGALYQLSSNIGLVKDLFLAKVKIIGNKVYIVPKNDTSFWEINSNYKFPDVLIEEEKYNASLLISTKVWSFSTDEDDYYTNSEYKGTTYEVKTFPKSYTDLSKVTMSGVEDLTFPVALGARKESLNIFELALQGFGKIADKLLNVFGGKGKYSNVVKQRKGLLKISGDIISVPKLLKLNSDLRLESNHRDIWSAKYLYDNYLNYDSYVLNNYGGQYKIYEKIRMNASYDDFLNVVENSVLEDSNGNKVKIESILYNFAGGFWEADYKKQYVFTKNLEEIYTEPE